MKEFIYKDEEPTHVFAAQKLEYLIKEETGVVHNTVSMGRHFSHRSHATYQPMTPIYSDIPASAVLHENYLEYLEQAYDHDYGIVVKPDFLWYTILCEFTRLIKAQPKAYQTYFTTSDTKIRLDGTSTQHQILDVATIFRQLITTQIPQALTEDLIVPKFTTLSEASKFAFQAAFLDAMAPYYEYGGYWCGYNKIKILGDIRDYQLMITTLRQIYALIPPLKSYGKHCIKVLQAVIDHWDDQAYWFEICKTEYGYAQRDVDGWFTHLFHDIQTKSQKSYPSHLSKIKYQDWHTGEEFCMYVGIMSSLLEDRCLVPAFNTVIMRLEKK